MVSHSVTCCHTVSQPLPGIALTVGSIPVRGPNDMELSRVGRTGGWVAAQYSSSQPQRCSPASSNVFSLKRMSHISSGHCANFSAATICTFVCFVWDFPRILMSFCKTLGEDICRYTRMGLSEVLTSWDGWLIVSQSRTTSCNVFANSKIRSISFWTSARLDVREFVLSMSGRFDWLFIALFLASEMSAVTRVMMTRLSKRRFRCSNKAFCIISVTS